MDKNSLEANLKELESIVSKMEQGDMALEDSIKSYEKGMLLLKLCQDSLKEIEQKVLVLSTENTLEKFKPTNE
ncbi:XseB Exonuclease VII small subunit [Candidatus Methylopumilus universalis]|jgi:exodeoxyribonuclease VII small subunit|uniref:Exodeoxyribonuclease 7 small subunit n=1 Tax=Candidatus Methylopumilus planktonicus TaxID=1581557 RepID=A0A0D6EU50_9PROT|nr:exodeoxyribonuclease VII small subunit [Candidatus Methylopumilus planktonicus]MDH4407773.1 exodeoxyribonuclease VII small subunit [Candidatus Methylopumilus sp.]GBL31871.1 exodeoxyribonuclease 7 small subunit [Methylophilaceae bacterium]QDD00011.1 exodeoxyribonuclease VII small subunit [Candidatus Methylopumilus planktonicus]QDD01338.1 exodeoxyribonuclease VII small subunit [Candidatus Methylopumilus planktonicus]QDD10594.1 exodeoxyribonuclease VII small subunit [Candidatus Methylopumilus 